MRGLENLNGMRILFFSVQTFNYENEIANHLRSFGAIVDYYDERPADSLFAKGIIRLKRSIYQNIIDRYYDKIIDKIRFYQYDFLFVIRGEVVPDFFLTKFKTINPDCKCIFYTWDSFTNNSYPISILKHFDRCFTFDNGDAQKFRIHFRPLFYLENYLKVSQLPMEGERLKYDTLFIGTAHSDRYIISNAIVNWCNQRNLTSYAYYYIQSKYVFAFKKVFDKSFKTFDYKKMSFVSLSSDEILNLYRNSAVIIDINHPSQSGLTMRTIEALAAGKKIITTNGEIKNYSFFNDNNIFVVDRDNPVLDITFFETPFIPLSDELRYKMSLTGWLCDLFINESEQNEAFWLNNN